MSEIPLIPRKILFGNPEKAGAQISPDGRMLAYLAPEEGVLNVWVRTTGATDDRAITHDRLRGIHDYFWQPGSRHILDMQDAGGNENDRIYQTDVATGVTRDLTPFENVRAMIIAVDASHPDFMLVALNNRSPELHDVYRLYFADGRLEPDTQNPGDVSGWVADHDFVVRAAMAMLPGGYQEIRIRDGAGASWKAFQQWGPDENIGGVAGFTPDNRSLLLISSVGANTSRLTEVEIATAREKVIAEDPHYDVSGAMEHPRTHKLEAVAFVRAKVEWEFLDPAIRADFDFLRQAHHGEIHVNNRDDDDRRWVVVYSADDAPARYFLYDRPTRRLDFLFAARPQLQPFPLAKMEPVSFPASDGIILHGYLTRPLNAQGPTPMVLLVHGGPWARDSWGYDPLVQLLANRGYTVLQVNFRGSTGYGKDFLNAGDREWAAKMHQDLLDAKSWAAANGHADPARVAIMGGSYGGYATLVGLTYTPEEFACGIDIVGPSNLITLLESIPPYWAPMRALFDKRVGHLEDEPEFLKSRSPLFLADRIKRPLLIGQGANDPRVKRPESDQIVAAMRANSLPVEYIVFDDEGHGFVRPENRLRFYAAAEQFLARYLGGRAEPPGDEENWAPFLR
jgi:dipeptidyl aminopeptidase/acylaminoacyl peptidase